MLRTAVIHAAVLVICINLVIDVFGGQGILVSLGMLLFFFAPVVLVSTLLLTIFRGEDNVDVEECDD